MVPLQVFKYFSLLWGEGSHSILCAAYFNDFNEGTVDLRMQSLLQFAFNSLFPLSEYTVLISGKLLWHHNDYYRKQLLQLVF